MTDTCIKGYLVTLHTVMQRFASLAYRGNIGPKSLGGGRVVRWYRVAVGQGPIVLVVGANGGCLDILLSSILSLLFLTLSGRRSDID